MTHNHISFKQLIVYVIHNQDYVFVTQFLSDFQTLIDTTNIFFFATSFIPIHKINNKLSLVSSNNVIHVVQLSNNKTAFFGNKCKHGLWFNGWNKDIQSYVIENLSYINQILNKFLKNEYQFNLFIIITNQLMICHSIFIFCLFFI